MYPSSTPSPQPARSSESALEANLMGMRFFNGIGVCRDPEKGLALLHQAAENGAVQAMGLLTNIYDMGVLAKADLSKMLRWGQKSAELGDSQSMIQLGRFYMYSVYGEPVDLSRAFYLLDCSAAMGNETAAQVLRSTHYSRPSSAKAVPSSYPDVNSSPKTVSEHYMRSEQYENGIGVKINTQQALMHRNLAAELGAPEAIYDLSTSYLQKEKPTAGDLTRGRALLEEAARLQHSDAMLMLGNCLFDGLFGFAKDQVLGKRWIEKSTELGFPDAAYRLSALAYELKDYKSAVALCKQAVDGHFVNASLTLASFHLNQLDGIKCDSAYVSGILRDVAKLQSFFRQDQLRYLDLLLFNNHRLFERKHGVITPTAMEYLTHQELGLISHKIALGDWGCIPAWMWEENDRCAAKGELFRAKYILDQDRVVIVTVGDDKSYCVEMLGENNRDQGWREWVAAFIMG